jgi:hypothetical protein
LSNGCPKHFDIVSYTNMAARASLTVCPSYILYLTATFAKADPK